MHQQDITRFITLLSLFYLTFTPTNIQAKALVTDAEKTIIERVQYLEDEIRRLNGKLEELEHKNYLLQKEISETLALRSASVGARNFASQSTKTERNNNDDVVATNNNAGDSNINSPHPSVPENESIKERYNHARNLLVATKYDYALKAFEDFTTDYPDDKLTIPSYYWIGEIYFLRSELERAAVAYGKSYAQYKKLKGENKLNADEYSKAPDSLVKLATVFKNMKKYDDANVTLTQLYDEFKNMPTTVKKQAQLLKRQIEIATG